MLAVQRQLFSRLSIVEVGCRRLYEDAFQTSHQQTTSGWRNARMQFRSRRSYLGPVRGLVLDWGGTVTDAGCCAPVKTLVELFQRRGVQLNEEEARAPVGLSRRQHVAALFQQAAVRQRWRRALKTEPTEQDEESLTEELLPAVVASLPKYCDVIDGVAETVKQLQAKGLKVGTTTGWPRQVLQQMLSAAQRQGFVPNASVCLDDLPADCPHPAPFMVWTCATRLKVQPVEAIVKVDDSAAGVREGSLAGVWTVAVAKTSSYVGLDEHALHDVDPQELERRLNRAYEVLSDAGAHFVIDSFDQLPQVVEEIDRRLAAGERP